MGDELSNLEYANGEWISKDHKSISLYGSGLFYGAGCFETMLAENGKIFKFSDHLNRLYEGLKYLGRTADSIPDAHRIREIISDLMERKRLGTSRCKIRFQCSLPERGYYQSPKNNDAVIVHITADKVQPPVDKFFTLKTVKTCVVPSVCKPAHLKLSNMLHYRSANNEAVNAGYDDALMLNVNGFVAETSRANIFWMKGDQIYTPSERCDILPGIMRNFVLKILRESFNDKRIIEGEFYTSSMHDADQIWITNSILEICKISQIDEKRISQNNLFINKLNDQLTDFKTDYME